MALTPHCVTYCSIASHMLIIVIRVGEIKHSDWLTVSHEVCLIEAISYWRWYCIVVKVRVQGFPLRVGPSNPLEDVLY